MFEFILVKVRPSPQTSVYDMGETLPTSHLKSNDNIDMLYKNPLGFTHTLIKIYIYNYNDDKKFWRAIYSTTFDRDLYPIYIPS